MALRLRRGNDAERQLITPVEGELIYTTDTERVFVGDGVTLGGLLVTGTGGGAFELNELQDVNIGSLTEGNLLSYDTATGQWIAVVRDDAFSLTQLSDVDLVSLTDGDILAYDTATSEWRAIPLPGSATTLSQLTDVNVLSASSGNVLAYDAAAGQWIASDTAIVDGANYNIGLIADDSSMLVDPNTKIHYGDFYGSLHSNDGNVLIDTDAGIATTTSGGRLIDFNSGQFEGDLLGNILGDDSTIFFNAADRTITATSVTIDTLETNAITSSDVNITFNRSTSPSPSITLDVTSIDGSPPILIHTLGQPTLGGTSLISFVVAHGDVDTPTLAVAGDYQGGISPSSINPGTLERVPSSLFYFTVDNNRTPATDFVPGKINLATNNGTRSSPDLKFMTFDSTGSLSVNQENATPGTTLDVNGIARLAPQVSPPSTPAEGMIAVADRATWDPASKGSGASYPVYYDGTIWNAFY